MKNFLILFLLICCCNTNLFSQSYQPKWGPVYKKVKGAHYNYQIIGIEKNRYYVLMQGSKSKSVLTFNSRHKLMRTKELNARFNSKKIVFEKMITTKTGTFGYFKLLDKKKDILQILISKFKNGNFGSLKKVHEYKLKLRSIYITPFQNPTNSFSNVRLIGSQDSTKFVYSNLLLEKNEQKLEIAVFDENLNLIWNKSIYYQGFIESKVVTNDGVVYLLCSNLNKALEKKRYITARQHKLFRITKDKIQNFDINIGEKFAPTEAVVYTPKNDNNTFMLFGFYTDAAKKSQQKGLFFCKGTANEEIISVKLHEFKPDFMEGLTYKTDIKKGLGISKHFDINHFFQYSDGSIGFIAEHTKITSDTYRDHSNGTSSTSYTYDSDDIIIPKFSLDGELMNLQKIDKGYITGKPIGFSYSFALNNDKIYLLFNDQKSKKEKKAIKKKAKIYTDLVVINRNGKIEYNKTLFTSSDIALYFMPVLSNYAADKWLIGSIDKSGKKYCFGTINLK